MHRVLDCVNAIKTNLWVECEFENMHGDTCRRAFKTRNVSIFKTTDLEDLMQELFEKLVNEKETCEMKGSGWTYVRVLDMQIRINVYQPLGGGSFIYIPEEIACKKAVVNVLNAGDEKCFEYAVLSKFVENPSQLQLRPGQFTAEVRARANLNFTGLDYPVRLEKIRIFEKNNPGVSVNVYGVDEEKRKKPNGQFQLHLYVYPLRVAKRELPNHFDLLFLTDEDTTHYAWIKDFEKLVRSQVTAHHGRIYVCKRCFAHFDERPNKLNLTGAERLAEHRRYCYDNAPLRTDVADETEIRFRRHERSQRSRFTIYADFECALVPHEGDRPLDPPATVPPPAWDPATARGELPHHHQGSSLDSAHVKTKKVHVPYAYAYYVRDDHRSTDEGDNMDDEDPNERNTFSKLRIYSGENAAKHFIESLRRDTKIIGDILYGRRRPRDRPQLTAAEEAAFQAETNCYICRRPFIEGDDDVKVRDHQHSPPYRYRGAAHLSCNLRFKEQDMVNVYLHNLSNYDAHFIVRELGVDGGEVNMLANTEEKYICFSKTFDYPGAGRRNGIRLRFVDSYRFLPKSLAGLAAILPVDKMEITRARYNDPEKFDLVRRKGVFPYEHITSLDVLRENVLPSMEAFRDNLRKEDITPEEYAHAQRVWTVFECETLVDYSDVYLTTDVLLLADVYESFRNMCLEHYNLDPAHYITLPSYAWDVMLFKTGVTLDTLQDVDQYLFFEKGIRGGLCQCVTRYAEANNEYTRGSDGRNDRGASTSNAGVVNNDYIMYYDANNLYGWAMSEPLPYGEFEWLSQSEIEDLNIGSLPADGDYGYVLEVDMEYPQDRDLHDRHRDLPFCPEVKRAPADRLPYTPQEILLSGAGKSPKLMATLMDKNNYVIHFRYLQQAMENGLRLRYIHRVLRFKQSAWLKPYVALNTRLRQQAKNKFETELFKLMVNAVYGMSLQNVRKHINVKLATSRKHYTKYVAKSNFSDRVWYNENLALLHLLKTRVVLDKPVYVGMCILDHSKWWMYGFHYKMVDRYGINNIRMLYMDTDGIFYKIRTDNVYLDMLEHRDDFDTSNYPRDHICYDERNARVLGKFKDEAGGVAIKLFIGLMAKLYCYVFSNVGRGAGNGDGNDDSGPPPVKRAKGVNRTVAERELTVEDYERCVKHHTVKFTENQRFQSRHHIIYTVMVTKRSMAPYDDKRYVIPQDGAADTLPWGHYGIPAPQTVPPLLPAPSHTLPTPSTSRGPVTISPPVTSMEIDEEEDD